jgi:hypothetical protein
VVLLLWFVRRAALQVLFVRALLLLLLLEVRMDLKQQLAVGLLLLVQLLVW